MNTQRSGTAYKRIIPWAIKRLGGLGLAALLGMASSGWASPQVISISPAPNKSNNIMGPPSMSVSFSVTNFGYYPSASMQLNGVSLTVNRSAYGYWKEFPFRQFVVEGYVYQASGVPTAGLNTITCEVFDLGTLTRTLHAARTFNFIPGAPVSLVINDLSGTDRVAGGNTNPLHPSPSNPWAAGQLYLVAGDTYNITNIQADPQSSHYAFTNWDVFDGHTHKFYTTSNITVKVTSGMVLTVNMTALQPLTVTTVGLGGGSVMGVDTTSNARGPLSSWSRSSTVYLYPGDKYTATGVPDGDSVCTGCSFINGSTAARSGSTNGSCSFTMVPGSSLFFTNQTVFAGGAGTFAGLFAYYGSSIIGSDANYVGSISVIVNASGFLSSGKINAGGVQYTVGAGQFDSGGNLTTTATASGHANLTVSLKVTDGSSLTGHVTFPNPNPHSNGNDPTLCAERAGDPALSTLVGTRLTVMLGDPYASIDSFSGAFGYATIMLANNAADPTTGQITQTATMVGKLPSGTTFSWSGPVCYPYDSTLGGLNDIDPLGGNFAHIPVYFYNAGEVFAGFIPVNATLTHDYGHSTMTVAGVVDTMMGGMSYTPPLGSITQDAIWVKNSGTANPYSGGLSNLIAVEGSGFASNSTDTFKELTGTTLTDIFGNTHTITITAPAPGGTYAQITSSDAKVTGSYELKTGIVSLTNTLGAVKLPASGISVHVGPAYGAQNEQTFLAGFGLNASKTAATPFYCPTPPSLQ